MINISISLENDNEDLYHTTISVEKTVLEEIQLSHKIPDKNFESIIDFKKYMKEQNTPLGKATHLFVIYYDENGKEKRLECNEQRDIINEYNDEL